MHKVNVTSGTKKARLHLGKRLLVLGLEYVAYSALSDSKGYLLRLDELGTGVEAE